MGSPRDVSSLPEVRELNAPVWYLDNGSDTVFIFVHGFNSDNRGCWLHKSSQGVQTFWPDLVSNDSNLHKPAVFLGGFPTSFESTEFGIRSASETLFHGLRRTQEGRAALDCSRLVFICHSTGGLVVPHMLVKQIEVFRDKTVGLLFVAVPSMGSPLASLANRLAPFLQNRTLQDLARKSQFTQELDHDFRALVQGERRLQKLYGYEGYEHHFVFRDRLPYLLRLLVPPKWRVVPQDSADRHFADSRPLYGSDHWSAAKPPDATHESHKMLVDLIQLIERSEKSIPDIDTLREHLVDRRVPPNTANRFYYGSRQQKFLGRQPEMQNLESFLGSDGDFKWWLLLGPAGAGKSRLALEACISHENEWATGFLGKDRPDNAFWRTWQPHKPTFIVVDYLPGREQPIQLMLLALADRRERIRHPIRILLLERGLEGAFEKVMGVGGDRAIIESKRFRGEPLTLSRLKDTDLVAIASESAVQAGGSTAPSTVIDALNNTGTATPLLAALLGEGKTDSGRTRDEFLISYLGREEARRWAPAKVGDRDKNLCGLATMLDGMNVEELAELRRDGIDFPTAKNYSPERLSAMTGFTTTDEVQPLRPHLIGEIFVLERLNSLNKIVRQNLLRLMWNAYPRCLQFLHRCREDFPHHRMTAQLSEAPKSASEPALEYSTLILFSDFLRCSGKASRPKARELLAALDRVNGQRGLPIRHNEFRQNQRTLAHLYWAAFEAEDGSPETAIKMVKEWAGHNLGDIQKDRWALDPFFVIPVSEVLQQIVTAFVGQQRYTEGYNAFLSLLFMAEQSEELEPAECLAKCSVAAGFALENAGEGKSALQQYERFRRLEAGLVKKQWLMRSANTTSRVRLDLLLAFAAKSLIVLMQSDSSVRRAAEASLIDLKQRTYGDSSSVPIASIYVQALILSDSELRILAGGKVPQRPIRNSKTLAELTGASKYYRKQADAFQELIASTVLLAESAIAFLDNDTRTAIPSWMVATQALKDAKRLDANLDHLAFWGAATLDLLTRILAANMESDFLRMTEVYLEAVEQVVENNGVFNHSMMDISLILLQYGVRLENDGDPTFMEKLTESTERMAYWAHERSKSSTNSG